MNKRLEAVFGAGEEWAAFWRAGRFDDGFAWILALLAGVLPARGLALCYYSLFLLSP